MQIFELTQPPKRTLKELDFGKPPPKKNFGTGVGPGVQPQYTATPRMKSAPQPGPAPRLPAPANGAVTTTAPAPELQTIDAPAQLPGPKPNTTKQLGTNYDPNVIDVDAKVKPAPAAQAALPAPAVPAQPTAAAPAAAPAPVTEPAAAPAPETEPAAAPTADPNKIKQTPNKAEKVDIGGSIVRAMRRYNANQAGLGWLNPDERNNLNNVQADKEGKITINGKPYNANDPAHVKAYKEYLDLAAGNAPAQASPAPPAAPPAPPAAPPAPPAGTPEAEPSGVEQALIKLGFSPQQAAITAKKVPPGMSEQDAIKLALSGRLRESLTWSRGFDPGRILYNKMKSQR